MRCNRHNWSKLLDNAKYPAIFGSLACMHSLQKSPTEDRKRYGINIVTVHHHVHAMIETLSNTVRSCLPCQNGTALTIKWRFESPRKEVCREKTANWKLFTRTIEPVTFHIRVRCWAISRYTDGVHVPIYKCLCILHISTHQVCRSNERAPHH